MADLKYSAALKDAPSGGMQTKDGWGMSRTPNKDWSAPDAAADFGVTSDEVRAYVLNPAIDATNSQNTTNVFQWDDATETVRTTMQTNTGTDGLVMEFIAKILTGGPATNFVSNYECNSQYDLTGPITMASAADVSAFKVSVGQDLNDGAGNGLVPNGGDYTLCNATLNPLLSGRKTNWLGGTVFGYYTYIAGHNLSREVSPTAHVDHLVGYGLRFTNWAIDDGSGGTISNAAKLTGLLIPDLSVANIDIRIGEDHAAIRFEGVGLANGLTWENQGSTVNTFSMDPSGMVLGSANFKGGTVTPTDAIQIQIGADTYWVPVLFSN